MSGVMVRRPPCPKCREPILLLTSTSPRQVASLPSCSCAMVPPEWRQTKIHPDLAGAVREAEANGQDVEQLLETWDNWSAPRVAELQPEPEATPVASPAVRLFDAGYHPLVRIRPGTKAPADRGWRNLKPTRELVEGWSPVGLQAAHFPGLDLDITDSSLADAVQRLATEHLGAAPVRGRPNSPKRLMVYRTAEPFPKMKATLTYHDKVHAVEVLGEGQQYLVEGLHDSGVPYEWEGIEGLWAVPLTELSLVTEEVLRAFLDTLKEALERSGKWNVEIAGSESRAGPAPPLPEKTPEGARNTTFASLAGTLRRRNFSQESAVAALLQENQVRCEPPLEGEEVEQIVDSIYSNYAPAEEIAVVPPEQGFRVEADADAAPQDPFFEESGTSPPFRTLGELREDPDLLKRPPALSRWLAWPGELTLLVGREKLGKSTLAAHDAVHAARDGHRVLWVSFEEGPARIVSRFVLLEAPDDEVLIVTLPPTSYQMLEDVVAQGRPSVVYVDSGASYVGATESRIPDSGQGEQWQKIYLRFKALAAQYACGVVVLVHANKSDGSLRGSTGIGAAADTILTMKPLGNPESTDRKIEVVGRWERRCFTLTLTVKDGQERYEEAGVIDAADEFAVEVFADPRGRIRACLRKNPGALASQIEKLPGRREIRAALREMIEDEEVRIERGERGAKHHFLVDDLPEAVGKDKEESTAGDVA